jgi:hypothetical protein
VLPNCIFAIFRTCLDTNVSSSECRNVNVLKLFLVIICIGIIVSVRFSGLPTVEITIDRFCYGISITSLPREAGGKTSLNRFCSVGTFQRTANGIELLALVLPASFFKFDVANGLYLR